MIVLRDIKQLEEKFCAIFNLTEFGQMEEFIERNYSEDELKNLFTSKVNLVGKEKELEDFSELIFQLKDYMMCLNNFIKILLITENYDCVFHFMRKIFVGQIGAVKYSSTKEQYNFIERYFDRFIEVVKNCEINSHLYLPLILKAFQSEQNETLFSWKRPAIEYMQTFFNANEEWTLEYIQMNKENKYKLFEIICDFNTIRGIKMLVDDFLAKTDFDEEKNTHILKKYKRETFTEIDKRLLTEDVENRKKLIDVLFTFGTDVEAQARIKEIFEKEENEEIKEKISKALGIYENVNLKSEKQFIYTAKRKIKEPQERTLGLPFDRLDLTFAGGEKADNTCYTYLIDIFKEEKNLVALKNLKGYKDIFVKETIEDFAEQLFKKLIEKNDIKEAKWAIRLCSLFASETFVQEICKYDFSLFENKRGKEGRYLLECLIYSGRQQVFEVLKKLKINQELCSDLEIYFNLYLDQTDKDKEVMLDELVSKEGTDEEFAEQANRLFWAFINDRSFSVEYFRDKFLKHPLFKDLAERLVWGEYRFNRLHNAFVIREDKVEYIIKTSDFKDDEIEIKIVHAQDCDERHDLLKNAVKDPLFNQFKKPLFDISEFNSSKVYVNRFCGMLVNVKDYVKNMEDYGFLINKHNNENMFTSMIHINEDLDIACVVEFERITSLSSENANLGFVVFYRLSDLLYDNGKYLTTKADAISIGGVTNRYFNYALSTILESVKK